mmetsp:Transcript_40515/g.101947  ORF Transcript_40515/g.101947 Transcript_40515/m.101947 type:complete len:355 (+) Transcript_40515:240-1304(+)
MHADTGCKTAQASSPSRPISLHPKSSSKAQRRHRTRSNASKSDRAHSPATDTSTSRSPSRSSPSSPSPENHACYQNGKTSGPIASQQVSHCAVEESHAQSKVSDSVATPGAVCNPPSGRGRILAGRYRLGRQLGSGTFARVYEATDLEVERRAGSTAEDARVAIKLFNRDMHLKEPWRAENEALLHGQLSSHPNVVSLIAAHLVPQPGRLSDTLLRAAAAAAFASAKSTSWPGSLAVPDSSFSAVAVESDAAAAAAAATGGARLRCCTLPAPWLSAALPHPGRCAGIPQRRLCAAGLRHPAPDVSPVRPPHASDHAVPCGAACAHQPGRSHAANRRLSHTPGGVAYRLPGSVAC